MSWTAPRTWVAGETLTAALLNTHLRDNLDAAFPVGSLHWRMQAATTSQTTIDGMLLECNAVSLLRTDFAALNTKLSGLSYPFGTVDGTHMTLPDLQARSPMMMSSGGHTDVNALGDSDGVTKANRTPKHNSTNSLATASDGAHTHTVPALNGGSPIATLGADVGVGTVGVTSGSSGTHTHTITGTIGPGGTRPIDSGTYLVVGVIGVKY